MRNLFLCVGVVVSALWSAAVRADVAAWNLPVTLESKNSEVKFEVDTTWHTVHGIAKVVEGRAWLADPRDPRSVKVELRIPVKELDTDNGSRDEEISESMEEVKFPNVQLLLATDANLCPPEQLAVKGECTFNLAGEITIRDVTKHIVFPSKIRQIAGGSYEVEGRSALNWLDFGIKDPSILVARVRPEMSVNFRVQLSK